MIRDTILSPLYAKFATLATGLVKDDDPRENHLPVIKHMTYEVLVLICPFLKLLSAEPTRRPCFMELLCSAVTWFLIRSL